MSFLLPNAAMARPTPAERGVDGAIHLLGVATAILACVALAIAARPGIGISGGVGIGLYSAGLLATFVCSALYNTAPTGQWKARLRRWDHAAIFAMIAGTVSPLALLAIGGQLGWTFFAVIWSGALAGASLKLFAPGRFERAAIGAYLALGWLGFMMVAPLAEVLSARDSSLLLAGGLLYSVGVVAHLWTRLPFHNAIWHALVLIAAGCHFPIVLGLAGLPPPA
ncbi:PAQR family membrane homeostasis protein TrhA [Roseococcus sp. YIM B11640]|uniref:PAQR family membrane homeostasis protein TrhA n=1 Tax=Roseococcus sp. YIM B11640 TaxID=3133973 RepID=UPI003C7DA58B